MVLHLDNPASHAVGVCAEGKGDISPHLRASIARRRVSFPHSFRFLLRLLVSASVTRSDLLYPLNVTTISAMASTTGNDTINGHGIRSVHDEEKGLHRTATGVTMSPELFEKLYLTPKVPHVGDYNKRFANPTALGLVG